MGWRVLAVMAGERFRGDGVVGSAAWGSRVACNTSSIFFVSRRKGSGWGTYRGRKKYSSEEGRGLHGASLNARHWASAARPVGTGRTAREPACLVISAVWVGRLRDGPPCRTPGHVRRPILPASDSEIEASRTRPSLFTGPSSSPFCAPQAK